MRKRIEAFKKVTRVIKEIPKIKAASRFKGEIGDAILQHYGLNTPWLDLVDNIFSGLWFARNETDKDQLNERIWLYKRAEDNKCGWIYLLKASYKNKVKEGIHSGQTAKWCDLRTYHSSLSLRPHIQHGIVLSKIDYSDSKFHLNDEIVATIKLPINLKNDIEDLKPTHMFPNKFYDNTYKYLLAPKINKVIEETEKEFDFKDKELGRIFTVVNK